MQGGQEFVSPGQFFDPNAQNGYAQQGMPQQQYSDDQQQSHQDPQQYHPQQQHQQQHQQQQQQQQPHQQQAGLGGGQAPAAFVNFAESPFTQIGLDYGQKLMGSSTEYMEQSINRWVTSETLKFYFNVNTSYVMNKIKLLLFPLSHKSWKRRVVRDDSSNVQNYLPPRDDINSPDLYIPIMAFVTYVMVYGFLIGTQSKFTPAVLGGTASTALGILLIEVVTLKICFYLMSNTYPVPLLDLICYGCYVFVGAVATILVQILFGTLPATAAWVVTSLFMAIFMVKTMRMLVLPDANSTSPSNRRNYFLLFAALVQFVVNFFLSAPL
eukprot:TRINITY_DN4606_c0_g2_i3.p1 TRINITY_DN4606_c0_g2~~TRINITY_DN4606_c0_g2_i3.p1  ORF type:complete len:325 (+),score=87.08 TRINITY_DN4606_c0_g2_i3:253-1227(+)